MCKKKTGVWLDYPTFKPDEDEKVIAVPRGSSYGFEVLVYRPADYAWYDTDDDFRYELDDIDMFMSVPPYKERDTTYDMRSLLEKAHRDISLADRSLTEFGKQMVFIDFEEGYEPKVSELHGEVFFEIEGQEISAERAIEVMEKRGYITPDDLI